jgi:hypothetical protein
MIEVSDYSRPGEEFSMVGAEWMGYLTAAKTALDIIRGVRSELPKGPRADEAQRQIEKAESALKVTEAELAELAKSLGFKLCKCRFPPPIMLWNAPERTNICPACGDRNPPPIVTSRIPDHEPDWIRARRG